MEQEPFIDLTDSEWMLDICTYKDFNNNYNKKSFFEENILPMLDNFEEYQQRYFHLFVKSVGNNNNNKKEE